MFYRIGIFCGPLVVLGLVLIANSDLSVNYLVSSVWFFASIGVLIFLAVKKFYDPTLDISDTESTMGAETQHKMVNFFRIGMFLIVITSFGLFHVT